MYIYRKKLNRIAGAAALGLVLALPQTVYGYSSATKVSVKNTVGATTNTIFSNDRNVTIRVSAQYCVNPNHSSGKYQFSFKLYGPNGKLLVEKKKKRKNIPSSGGKITRNFKLSLDDFSRGYGNYRIKGIYKEFLDGKTTSSAADRRIFYSSSTYNANDLAWKVKLLTPQEGAEVFEKFPQFQWTPVSRNVSARYSIWISENSNPLINPIYKKQRLKTVQFRYPNEAVPLKYGRTYYWKVRSFDENGQPIGGLDGYSDTGSFYISNSLLPKLKLTYPTKNDVLTQKMENFRWEEIPISDYYNITIFKNDRPIWVGQSSVNEIQIDVNAILGEGAGNKFKWQVSAHNALDETIAASVIEEFSVGELKQDIYSLEVPGKSGIKGMIRNIFNEPLENAVVVVSNNSDEVDVDGSKTAAVTKQLSDSFATQDFVEGKDYEIAAGTVTLLANRNGSYSFELPVGEWLVAYYKDNHELEKKVVTVQEDTFENVDVFLIPVFGTVSGYVRDLDTGEPVAGVRVGFRNIYNYQFAETNENGYYIVPMLINGDYTIEVTKDPDYKEIIEANFTIKGERFKKNYRIERIKAGAIAGKVFRSLTGEGISRAELSVRPLRVNGRIKAGKTEGSAITTSDGSFLLPDLRIGLYKIYAKVPGFPRIETRIKVESAATTKYDFDISTIKWKVSGVAQDNGGRNLNRVRIQPDGIPDIARVLSKPDGTFEIMLSNGTYKLRFHLPGKEIVYKKITVKDGDLDLDEVLMVNTKGYLSFNVRAGGKTVTDYEAELSPGSFKFKPGGKEDFLSAPGNTDYKIKIKLGDSLAKVYHGPTIDFAMGEGSFDTLTVDLQKKIRFAGVVQDKKGTPVVRALITDPATGEKYRTDSDGLFSFDSVAAPAGAQNTLELQHPEFFPLQAEVKKPFDKMQIVMVSQAAQFSAELLEKYERMLAEARDQETAVKSDITYRLNAGSGKSMLDTVQDYNNSGQALTKSLQDEQSSLQSVMKAADGASAKSIDALIKALAASEAKARGAKAEIVKLRSNLKAVDDAISGSGREQIDKEYLLLDDQLANIQQLVSLESDLTDDDKKLMAEKIAATKDGFAKSKTQLLDSLKLADAETAKAQTENLIKLAETELDKLNGLIAQAYASFESLGLAADDPRVLLANVFKRKLEIEKKAEAIKAGFDSVYKKYNDAREKVKALRSGLKDVYAQLANYELKTGRFLEKLAETKDNADNFIGSLQFDEFGGFKSKITAKPIPGKPGIFSLHGFIVIEHPDFGRRELDIIPASKPILVDVSRSLPREVARMFEADFLISEFLPRDIQPLYDPATNSFAITGELNPAVLDFIENENWLDVVLKDSRYAKLNEMDVVAEKVATVELFDGTKLAGPLSAADVNTIKGRGVDYFLEKSINPDYLAVTKVRAKQLFDKSVEDWQAEWPDLAFGRDYSAWWKIELEAFFKSILPREISAKLDLAGFSPGDFNFDLGLELLVPRAKLRYIPDDLSLDWLEADKIQAVFGFSFSDLKRKITFDLPALALKNPIELKNYWQFSFSGMDGQIGPIEIGYSRSKGLIFIKGSITIDFGLAIEAINGVGNLESKGGVTFFGDGTAEVGQLVFKIDSEAEVNLLGFSANLKGLVFDFKRKRIIVAGSIYFREIDKRIDFERATFDGNQGWKLTKINFSMSPPLRFEYFGWKIVLMKAYYDKKGIHLEGDMELGKPFPENLDIEDLTFNPKGQIAGITIKGMSFKLFGGNMAFKRATFSTHKGKLALGIYENKLDLPIMKNLKIKKIKFIKDNKGKMSFGLGPADIPIGDAFDFSGFPVGINDISLGTEGGKLAIGIDGEIDFFMPTVDKLGGRWVVDTGGKLTLNKFGFCMNVGIMAACAEVDWRGNTFKGKGSVLMIGIIDAELEFAMGNGDWKAKFALGIPPMVLGPVTVFKVLGGLEKKRDSVIVSFGGEFIVTIAPVVVGTAMMHIDLGRGALIMEADAMLSPGGIAAVTAASIGAAGGLKDLGIDLDKEMSGMSIKLAEADVIVVPAELLFDATCKIGFNMAGIKNQGIINVHIDSKSFGAGAYVMQDYWGLLKGNGGFAFGYNYKPPGNFKFRGNTVRIPPRVKGFLFTVGVSANLDLAVVVFKLKADAFIHLGYPLAGGLWFEAQAKVDLVILAVGVQAYLDLGGQVGEGEAYFAGAIGARGCISILGGTLCASTEFKFTIGTKPKYLADSGFSEKLKVSSEPIELPGADRLAEVAGVSIPKEIILAGGIHFENNWFSSAYGADAVNHISVDIFVGSKRVGKGDMTVDPENPAIAHYRIVIKTADLADPSMVQKIIDKKLKVQVKLKGKKILEI